MTPRPVEVELHKYLSLIPKKSFLLAVSGGIDSMAMLYAFNEMKKRMDLDVRVAHIHHGRGNPEVVTFRNQSFEVVKETCEEFGLSFFSNIESVENLSEIPDYGSSEESFRRLRYEALLKIKTETKSHFVVFAHHRDDLLETRLMRLLRGCGAQGLMAMSPKKGIVLRPFLRLERAQMEEYVHGLNAHYVDDPTHGDFAYLRNWVRGAWLPALESRVPGSKAVIANSLNLIAYSVAKSELFSQCFTDDGKIIRSELLSLSLEEKKRVFALYLKRKNVKNYGLSHVNELVKRLDVERNELTFKLAQKNWLANARHIWCED